MEAEDNFLAAILASYVFDDDEEELTRKKRKVWRKNWVERREREGFCAKLYRELREEEPELLHNFLRMTADQFDHLLALDSPLIVKQDTVMRDSISASDRVILTLRYLATGDNFRSLEYLFRIPHNTISTIIPEVLDAIYKVLVDEYLSVCFSIHSFFPRFDLIVQTPRFPDAWKAVVKKFNELWQIPNCIGAVDGKHVVMVAPPHGGSIFYNYRAHTASLCCGCRVQIAVRRRWSQWTIF